MRMSPTPDQIRALYQSAGLKRAEAAKLLGVPLETFISWLRPATSKSQRDMPATVFELLEIKIAALNKIQGYSRESSNLMSLSVTEARTKLAGVLSVVLNDRQPVVIDSKKGRAVLVSEDDWIELQQIFGSTKRKSMAKTGTAS